MTIEIRELVIRATVVGSAHNELSQARLATLLEQQKRQILKECHAQLRAQLQEELAIRGRISNER
ncbi:MAG: hypothetical protein KGM99_04620 [Burkholderiales bacterium]|nr:hypothetical protein [Burkholderiales bacterium]